MTLSSLLLGNEHASVPVPLEKEFVMAIDVFKESVLSLAEATKRLPRVRRGKKPHVSSLYRWAKRGKRCSDGTVARLEIIKVGGTTCTSLEALQRFFDRLTGERDIVSPPTITERQRLQEMEAVERELDALGY
jgi:hypothetical protein